MLVYQNNLVNMFFKSLTPKQKQILDFIQLFVNKNGYAPSLEEIANKFHRAIPTIHQYIETLKEKGFLNKEENVSRGIQLKQEYNAVFLLGYITAGEPIEPFEHPELISVPESITKVFNNYYALKVKGDSMIDEGIIDGDTIIVRHQQAAENGDIVVAITENGATLKKFRRINGKIFLEPRNKKYKVISPKNLEIRGKFIGLIRTKKR